MKNEYSLVAALCGVTLLAGTVTASDLTPTASTVAASTTQQAPAPPSCEAGDAFCISTNDANAKPAIGQNANPLAPLTSMLPTQGIIAAGPATQPSGAPTPVYYLFYDGNPTDMDPFGGYLGLNTADANKALLGVVGSLVSTDNFNRLGGNNPIISIDALNQSLAGIGKVGK